MMLRTMNEGVNERRKVFEVGEECLRRKKEKMHSKGRKAASQDSLSFAPQPCFIPRFPYEGYTVRLYTVSRPGSSGGIDQNYTG